MTQSEYEAWLARTEGVKQVHGCDEVYRELAVHTQILGECRRRGWYIVHARPDVPTTTGRGVPDFVIATEGGKTLWVEVKAAKGKLSLEQRAAAAWLQKLGHDYAVVHSLQEFIELVRKK